jgi:hypothetical protein
MNQTGSIKPQLTRVQVPAIIIGVLGLAGWAAGFLLGGGRDTFFQSYLFAFLFWLALPLGSLALLMLQYLTGGKWGYAVRRLLEASALTIPLMAVIFIPIALFAMPDLYPWAQPDTVAHDVILQRKAPYLNVSFFYIRAGVYFVLWMAFLFFLNRWSRLQDTTDKDFSGKLRALSGPGIVLYILTMTFASFDWGMSLEPHWFSAIYGVIFIIGQGLTTFAFMIMMIAILSKREPMQGLLSTKHFHDLGNLLFAFTILWTYMSLSQFIIIWSGNLPEETPWYIHRNTDGWNVLAVAIILVQFVLPFFLLLQRFMKRKIEYLWKVALVIFVMRFVDLFWIVVPAFNQRLSDVHWMNYVAPIGLGGVWIWIFLEILKRRPILSTGDPQYQEALGHG